MMITPWLEITTLLAAGALLTLICRSANKHNQLHHHQDRFTSIFKKIPFNDELNLPICSLNEWQSFKLKYSKNYDEKPEEDLLRASIYCTNFKKVIEHNALKNKTYKLDLNHLSDRKPDEIEKFLGQIENYEHNYTPNWNRSTDLDDYFADLSEIFDINAKPPLQVDWSKDPRRVSLARDQGDCGSCWAFGVVGLLEGQQKPAKGRALIELSEQNLLDCDQTNSGCEGGHPEAALKQLKQFGGLMARADYPYESGKTGDITTCKLNSTKVHKSTKNLGKIIRLQPRNETLLMQVVANYGPVVAGLHAKLDLIQYKSGIYGSDSCQYVPNHIVLIVGYGRDKKTGLDYWKYKNSLSSAWGQKGFGLISRDNGKNCQITSETLIILPQSTD